VKILFIYPSIDPSYPLQLGALSAYVKQRGHQTMLYQFDSQGSTKVPPRVYEDLEEEIGSFQPHFVGFSCYEMSFPLIKKISRFIKKKWPEIEIIVGGYYATLVPDDVISFEATDIVCIGEGERPLAVLLDSREKGDRTTQIGNLWFKKNHQIIKNPIGPLIEDLDELPFPDRGLLDYQAHLNLEKRGQRNVKVMAGRGCPYVCTYCCNKYFRALYPNQHQYLRYRSPPNVVSEIKNLVEKYQFERVGFHDDNFTLNLGWLKSFTKLYRKEIGLPFYCAARVESCTDKVLDLLKEAGCYMLLIGVESGDEDYRRKVMRRFMSNRMIFDVFRRARERGILTWSFTMVGLPFENWRMIFKTLWLNWRCRPDFVMASIFYPLKGTELGDICYKKGWVNLEKREKISSYAWETILNHPILSERGIRLAKYLNSLTASRSRFFWRILLERSGGLLTRRQRI